MVAWETWHTTTIKDMGRARKHCSVAEKAQHRSRECRSLKPSLAVCFRRSTTKTLSKIRRYGRVDGIAIWYLRFSESGQPTERAVLGTVVVAVSIFTKQNRLCAQLDLKVVIDMLPDMGAHVRHELHPRSGWNGIRSLLSKKTATLGSRLKDCRAECLN